MSRIIALVNQKGGVGKTTNAINIGAALAVKKKKVLLIDLDSQASLTAALGAKGASPTIYEVMRGELSFNDVLIPHGAYTLAPSNVDLSGLELELSSIAGRECILKEAIEDIKSQYDYILIDCPPSLSILTLNALVAATEVFIILQTEYLAMEGTSQLLKTVDLVKKRLNPSLAITGIVATQYDSRIGLHNEVLTLIRTHFPNETFKTPISKTIVLAEASSFGQDVFEYRPKSKGALDYENLVKEIIKQEKKNI